MKKQIVATILAFSVLMNTFSSTTGFAETATEALVNQNVWKIQADVGAPDTTVILTLGVDAYEVTTDENGYLYVMTQKSEGMFYVEHDSILTKYRFNNGVITGTEEVTPSILSISGLTELLPGETLWLRVNAEAVTSTGKLRYQWYKDGIVLEGATSAVYTKKGVACSDSGVYSVEVSQVGASGVVTRSSDQVVTISSTESGLTGAYVYNVSEGESVQLELQSSSGSLTTTIVEGNAKIDGMQVSPLTREVILEVTDGVSTKRVYISCNSIEVWNENTIQEFQYDGKPHPFSSAGVVGLQSCVPQYTLVGFDDWSSDAPVSAGEYVAKLQLSNLSGEEFIEFASIIITKKELTIYNLQAQTKTWDGTPNATIFGELIGIIGTDDVSVRFPKAEYKGSDAGTHKVIVDGEAVLKGADSANYRLNDYSVDGLSGMILKKNIVVTAVSKSSKQGEPMKTLTYTTSGNAGSFKGVKLTCDVTSNSPVGKYVIEVIVPKTTNYNLKAKNGVYTILQPDKIEEEVPIYDTIYGTTYDNTVWDDDPDDSYYDDVIEDDWYADGGNEETEQKKKKKKRDEEVKFNVSYSLYDVQDALTLDGLSKIDMQSVEADQDILVFDYWITNGGILQAREDSGVAVRTKKGKWKSSLEPAAGMSADYVSADNYTFWAKIGDRKVECCIRKFIRDRQLPEVTVSGVEDGSVLNTALHLTVDTVWGTSGKKLLTYKLVRDRSQVAGEDGWHRVDSNQIIVDQEFEGYVAVKAIDNLGNECIVYSGKFCLDTGAPTINGVSFGEVYTNEVSYSVEDKSGVQSVVLDGTPVGESGTVLGGGLHTLEATDVNGNYRSITFTVEDSNIINKVLHYFNPVK